MKYYSASQASEVSGAGKLRSSSGRGFTLIELLVVISVIALLLSILMPSLQKAKERAKAVVCMQNLKQWGYIIGAYTEEHNGSFWPVLAHSCTESWMECLSGCFPCPHPPPAMPNSDAWVNWFDVLRPYYKPSVVLGQPDYDCDFSCCPTATKPTTEGGRHPFAAWGRFDENRWCGELGQYGSYGLNYYVGTGFGSGAWGSTTRTKMPSLIPVLLDAQWEGGTYQRRQVPPEFDGQDWWTMGSCCMGQICLNRHPSETINAVFMDFNVRKVGLKELWRLHYHRGFDEYEPLPFDWPAWMENFKDYGDG